MKPLDKLCPQLCLRMTSLLQNTEEEHEDKQRLLAAVNGMTQVAAAINEFKRRKDLGTYAILVVTLSPVI